MSKQFYCVYRTDGTLNATWNRSLAMPKAEAEQARTDIEKGGRKCFIVEKSLSDAIGLPEGYEYKQAYQRTQ